MTGNTVRPHPSIPARPSSVEKAIDVLFCFDLKHPQLCLGVPLTSVLAKARLNDRAAHVRVEGWDRGVPASAKPGTPPFYYDEVGRVEPQTPRVNNMRKNINAIVATDLTIV
jgi:hypothetical protein